MDPVTGSSLWSDVVECPEVLAALLDGTDGLDEAVALVRTASRVVLTGNGAALYAASALWHAAHRFPAGPPACLVPAGLMAAGGFRPRPGDVTVAVSSSGELRDLVELLPDGLGSPLVVLTGHAGSALGRAATVPVLVPVGHQRAVTHTQAFLGNVLVSLLLWDGVTGGAVQRELGSVVRRLPERLALLVDEAPGWADGIASRVGSVEAAVVLGTAGGWTAAMEAALLLKEVAGIPAEGLETREGATTGSYALSRAHLALLLEAQRDPFVEEAAVICSGRGAAVVRTPAACRADPLLLALTTFPAATALAATLGVRGGLDIERPAWTDAYFATARRTSDPKGTA